MRFQTSGSAARSAQVSIGRTTSQSVSGSTSGKLKLAAIVHYDSIKLTSSIGTTSDEASEEKKNSSRSNNNKTGEKFASKLGKLFTRNKSIKKSKQTNESHFSDGGSQRGLNRSDENCKVYNNDENKSKKMRQQEPDATTTTTSNKQVDDGSIIEFKFDLIVDNATAENRSVETSEDYGERKHLDGKLLESVDDLVESFVLNSNDVCLMSVGREQIFEDDSHLIKPSPNNCDRPKVTTTTATATGNKTAARKEQPSEAADGFQFEFIYRLASHTLNRSFELLLESVRDEQEDKDGSSSSNFDPSLANFRGKSQPVCSPGEQSDRTNLSSNNKQQQQQQRDTSLDTNELGNKTNGADSNNQKGSQSSSSIEVSASLISLERGRQVEICDLFGGGGDVAVVVGGQSGANGATGGRSNAQEEGAAESGIEKGKENANANGSSNRLMVRSSQEEIASASIDCHSVRQARQAMQELRSKLIGCCCSNETNSDNDAAASDAADGGSNNNSNNSQSGNYSAKQPTRRLLLVGLKLKRRINGGLFTNRLCLIDFEPELVELQPIFANIFNGQALAYLKRRRNHLQSLETLLASSGSNSKTSGQQEKLVIDLGRLKLNNITNKRDPLEAQQQFGPLEEFRLHHNCNNNEQEPAMGLNNEIGSLSALIKAEWLLYKQLSSALIRTLLIVHVHKLTSSGPFSNSNNKERLAPPHSVDTIQPDCNNILTSDEQRHLIDYNLVQLEFARSIQRASTGRLRRRRQQFKSHLSSCNSNTSLTSNMSATATTATVAALGTPLKFRRAIGETIDRNGANNMLLYDDDYDGHDEHRQQRQQHRLHHNHHNHSKHNHHYHSHHHHQYNHHHNRHHSQHQRVGPLQQYHLDHPLDSYLLASSSLNNNNLQTDYFTESSSMSTSSGGGRRHGNNTVQDRSFASKSAKSTLKRAGHGFGDHESELVQQLQANQRNLNLSDSDSVASANLNSYYSTSSFTIGPNSYSSRNGRHRRQHHGTRSRNKHEIELKWFSKQQENSRQVHDNTPKHQQSRFSPITTSKFAPILIDQPQHITKNSQQHQQISSHHSTTTFTSQTTIPIDCPPSNESGPTSMGLGEDELDFNGRRSCEDNTDNVSDICSLVAEPPKQLKLEEFLNQLSGVIAPISVIPSSSSGSGSPFATNPSTQIPSTSKRLESSSMKRSQAINQGQHSSKVADTLLEGRVQMCQKVVPFLKASIESNSSDSSSIGNINNRETDYCRKTEGQEDDDDEEDCKSHSSILDHLSSLANSKLLKENHQQRSVVVVGGLAGGGGSRTPPTGFESAVVGSTDGKFLALDADESSLNSSSSSANTTTLLTPFRAPTPIAGHLQRLMNGNNNSRLLLLESPSNCSNHLLSSSNNHNSDPESQTQSSRVAVRTIGEQNGNINNLSTLTNGLSVDCSRALLQHQQQVPCPLSAATTATTTSSSGAFTPSSNDSNCGSSSPPSNGCFDGEQLCKRNVEMFGRHHHHHDREPEASTRAKDLYASVVK